MLLSVQVNDPFGMFGNGQQRGQELQVRDSYEHWGSAMLIHSYQAKLEVELAEMYSGGKREVFAMLRSNSGTASTSMHPSCHLHTVCKHSAAQCM